jgi:hypothetical protein
MIDFRTIITIEPGKRAMENMLSQLEIGFVELY